MNGSQTRPIDTDGLDLLRLRFADADLERAFRVDYAHRTRAQTRVSLALGLIIYLALGFQDPWFFPADTGAILVIRLCVSATILVSLAVSLHPRFDGLQQPWLMAQMLIVGGGVLWMIARGDLNAANSYSFGVTLVIVWGFNFSGLRFYPALGANLILIVAYAVVFSLFSPVPARWFYTDLSNTVAAAMITGFAGFLIERQRRVLFQQHCIIDQERQSHQQLALFDQLTGLPNRVLFEQRLAEALLMCARRGDNMAVLFLDVDRFKPVNDAFGHSAGDRALSVLASRLRSCVRQEDVVARIGGDEFLILIRNFEDAEDVSVVARKILTVVEKPLSFRSPIDASGPVQVSVSIGIALYPVDGNSAEELIQAADAAMYMVKAGGRNGYRFHATAALTANEA